jgi:hypothetical protein
VADPTVLHELLAVIGGDDDRRLCVQTEAAQLLEEARQYLVGVANASVVEGLEVVDLPRLDRDQPAVDRADWQLVEGSRRFPGPEHRRVRFGRLIRTVDRVGVEKQEEPVLGVQPAQKGESFLEGLLDVRGVLHPRIGDLVETARETVAPADIAALGVAGGSETGLRESFGQRLDRRREPARGRIHAMLLRVETGE